MSDTSSAEKFLQSFHDARPGTTSSAFGRLPVLFRGDQYPSSYEALATVLPKGHRDACVLDLACGDGFLLSLLSRNPSVQLNGVDLSGGELRCARERLGAAATLLLARAQSLPFPNENFDYVFCHLALMLMDGVDEVLREVQRVLKPGGIFAGVVGGGVRQGAASSTFVEAFSRYSRQPQYMQLRIGDRRLRTASGIEELVTPVFSNVTTDEFLTSRQMAPDELWTWLLGMYDLHLLTEADRMLLRQEFLSALAPACEPDGTVRYEYALWFFSASKN